MATTQKVLTYTLHVVGLFGRNRTVKRDSFRLAEVPEERELSVAEVRAKVDAQITQIRPKASHPFKWQVIRFPETLEHRDDGITIRSFGVSDGSVLLKGTVANGVITAEGV